MTLCTSAGIAAARGCLVATVVMLSKRKNLACGSDCSVSVHCKKSILVICLAIVRELQLEAESCRAKVKQAFSIRSCKKRTDHRYKFDSTFVRACADHIAPSSDYSFVYNRSCFPAECFATALVFALIKGMGRKVSSLEDKA